QHGTPGDLAMTAGWRLPAILPDPHHFRMGDMIASAALSSVAPRFVNARVRALIDFEPVVPGSQPTVERGMEGVVTVHDQIGTAVAIKVHWSGMRNGQPIHHSEVP